ncbi:MAG: hypothetical protein ABEH38_05655 [Flavobacteriales bacterium]
MFSYVLIVLCLFSGGGGLPKYVPQKPNTAMFKGSNEFHGDLSLIPNAQASYSFSDHIFGEVVGTAANTVRGSAGIGYYDTFLESYGRWGVSGGGGYGPLEGSAYLQAYVGGSGHVLEGGLASRLVYVNRWGHLSEVNGLLAEPSLFARIGWKNVKAEGLVGWSGILAGPSFDTGPNIAIGIHFYFGGQHESAEENLPSKES